MIREANVSSVEVLERFRARLIVYLADARRAVHGVGDEVKRARLWLESEQRVHWEGEIKRRSRRLDQARAELMTARHSQFKDSVLMQERAVARALAAVDEATAKLAKVRQWTRMFDQQFVPLVRRVENLSDYLEHDMPPAVMTLLELQKALDAYVETDTTAPSPPSPSLNP